MGIWWEYDIMCLKQCHKPPHFPGNGATIAPNKKWWLGDGKHGMALFYHDWLVPIRRLWSKREDLLSKLQAEEHHRRELHKQSQHLLLGHPWQVHLPCRTQWFPLSGYLNEWLASWLASIQKRFSRSGSVTNFASVTEEKFLSKIRWAF